MTWNIVLIVAALFGPDAVAAESAMSSLVINSDAKQLMRRNHAEAPKPDAKKKTVSLNLYYETKCPDCIEFINQTLAAMWKNKDLRPHLNITMNPYGNAMSLPIDKVSEGYKFWHPETTTKDWKYVHICQHGSDECLGNLIQACAISHVKHEQFMELVFCMAAKPNWSIEKSSYDCMGQNKIDQKKVKECVNSPAGNELFAKFGEMTQEVQGRQGTPWVMINGKNLQKVDELTKTVCTQLGDDGPASCDPFKSKKADSNPTNKDEDDGDFTVLPVISKKILKDHVEFPLLSPEHI